MRAILLAVLLAAAALPAAALTVTRNLAYGPDVQQKIDVYHPDRPNGRVLVFLHGGAWAVGDKANAQVRTLVRHYAELGYLAVSVNTRLLPEARPEEQAQDFARATALVQQRARAWGADPSALTLMGHSAGAHIVALLAADADLRAAHGVAAPAAAVILDSAALDVPALMQGRPLRLHRRAFGEDPAGWTLVSPQHRLSPGAPPMLVVCSTRRTVPCPEARGFAAEARRSGAAVTVMPVDLSHADTAARLASGGAYGGAVDAWIAGNGG